MLDRTDVTVPRAAQNPSASTWHGVKLVDEYAWLRAANWQEVMRDPDKLAPVIRDYLQAENAYAEQVLGDTIALQDALFAEMKGRIKEDDSTVPDPDGPYSYYVRFREGGQHPVACRQGRTGGGEQILLDGDALAHGKGYFQLGGTSHSPDHRLLAWSSDEAGAEFHTIRIRDLVHHNDLSDIVPDATGAVVWTGDASAFYYVRLDRNHRPSRVFRHKLATPVEDDVLVFEETRPGFFVAISEMQSRRYADISVHDHETSESRLLDLADLNAVPVLVAPREGGVQYHIEHHPALFGEDALVMRTNADGAEDFKIVWAPRETPGRAEWRDLVPHRPGIYVLSFLVLANWLVRLEREDGLPRIVVRRLDTGEEHAIAFAEEAYSLGIDGGYEFSTDILRFTYSSMTTPAEIWDYDMAARSRILRKRQEIPSGHDRVGLCDAARAGAGRRRRGGSDLASCTARIWCSTARPHACSMAMAPTGCRSPPPSAPAGCRWSIAASSLPSRMCAAAPKRAGAGTARASSTRSRTRSRISSPPPSISSRSAGQARRSLVAQGGSAGGLLMGAVANMAPHQFGAIIAEVPFVDVLNTILDESLPLTPPEWPEWGNPVTDEQAFHVIASYSPYDNVRAQDYPNMLVLAGLSDPRVTYWEPAKWVARLRQLKTDTNLIAFRTNMEAGHAGASGRFDRLKEVALGYAFAIKMTGGSLSA